MRKPMTIKGTVYVEIPVQWEDDPDYPASPLTIQQELEKIIGDAVAKATYPPLARLCVTVEAQNVTLEDANA